MCIQYRGSVNTIHIIVPLNVKFLLIFRFLDGNILTKGSHSTSVEGSKIQMQPLNFEIANACEENIKQGQGLLLRGMHRGMHTNRGVVPPSSQCHSISTSF